MILLRNKVWNIKRITIQSTVGFKANTSGLAYGTILIHLNTQATLNFHSIYQQYFHSLRGEFDDGTT